MISRVVFSSHAVFPASAEEEDLGHFPEKDVAGDALRRAAIKWVLGFGLQRSNGNILTKAIAVMTRFIW